jgi:tyrosinase
MALLLRFGDSDDPRARYLGWAPVPVSIRLSDAPGTPVSVVVRNRDTTQGGQLVFQASIDQPWSPEIRIEVPGDGSPTTIGLAGRFPIASQLDGDAVLEAVPEGISLAPAAMPVMVRVRKDANGLSPGERDLFLDTVAAFNDGGEGRCRDFREIHDLPGTEEMHSHPGFLAWHRAYLLDFERELQAIEPAVALPYWRFDKAAPNLFARDFIGEEDWSGRAALASTNPLTGWVTDQTPGINRQAVFDNPPAFEGPVDTAWMNTVESATVFETFWTNLDEVHGAAHRAFMGFLEELHTSARDPLFFLLHAGVDRVWARWQNERRTHNPGIPGAYVAGTHRVGHNLGDTMWPWNQITGDPRPPHAPGGTLCQSPSVQAPGLQPRVRQMFDYQGFIAPANQLGFDYDDVPFPGIDLP